MYGFNVLMHRYARVFNRDKIIALRVFAIFVFNFYSIKLFISLFFPFTYCFISVFVIDIYIYYFGDCTACVYAVASDGSLLNHWMDHGHLQLRLFHSSQVIHSNTGCIRG